MQVDTVLPANEQMMKMIPEVEETDDDNDDTKFQKSLRVSIFLKRNFSVLFLENCLIILIAGTQGFVLSASSCCRLL